MGLGLCFSSLLPPQSYHAWSSSFECRSQPQICNLTPFSSNKEIFYTFRETRVFGGCFLRTHHMPGTLLCSRTPKVNKIELSRSLRSRGKRQKKQHTNKKTQDRFWGCREGCQASPWSGISKWHGLGCGCLHRVIKGASEKVRLWLRHKQLESTSFRDLGKECGRQRQNQVSFFFF